VIENPESASEQTTEGPEKRQSHRAPKTEERLRKLEELAKLRVRAEERALEAEEELARLRRAQEEARLRMQEEVARLRAQEDVVVQEAREELARLEEEEETAQIRLGLEAERTPLRDRRERPYRRRRGWYEPYDREDERDVADFAGRAVDEASNVVEGATIAYLEGLRSVTEIAKSLTESIYGRAREREAEPPRTRRRQGRPSQTRRRGTQLEVESRVRRPRERASDVIRGIPGDVYSGLMDALDDYVDVSRSAIDRFYESYSAPERR
jgi:dTMP kinase